LNYTITDENIEIVNICLVGHGACSGGGLSYRNKSGLSGNQLMAASLGSQLERTKGVLIQPRHARA
jgi:hypothetical protein